MDLTYAPLWNAILLIAPLFIGLLLVYLGVRMTNSPLRWVFWGIAALLFLTFVVRLVLT